MAQLSEIFSDSRFKAEDIPPFEEKLFFEGTSQRLNLERFGVLLGLATVIATYGVLGDSTATVIGAMIIAPLMTPIMATTAGIVMGNMARAGRALLLVVTGVAGVILTSGLISMFLNPTIVSFSDNAQITARIAPSLVDLAVALAAGAAAAFAMSRSDISDSLPGVAISISLVPPLCVVGIGLAEGRWEDALGSMVLFLTNFLSILLAGGGVLSLLGLSSVSTNELRGSARRNAYISIFIGLMLVSVPLVATTLNVVFESLNERYAEQTVRVWLDDSEYKIDEVEADGRRVNVTISGAGSLPDLLELSPELKAELENYFLEIEVIPSETIFYP